MASKEYISTTSSVAAVPRSKRLREAGGGTSGGGGGHSVVNVNMDADVSGKADIDDVERALAEKQDVLTFDTTPTTGSTNPVTSGGVAAAIAAEATARQNADALKADKHGNAANWFSAAGYSIGADSIGISDRGQFYFHDQSTGHNVVFPVPERSVTLATTNDLGDTEDDLLAIINQKADTSALSALANRVDNLDADDISINNLQTQEHADNLTEYLEAVDQMFYDKVPWSEFTPLASRVSSVETQVGGLEDDVQDLATDKAEKNGSASEPFAVKYLDIDGGDPMGGATIGVTQNGEVEISDRQGTYTLAAAENTYTKNQVDAMFDAMGVQIDDVQTGYVNADAAIKASIPSEVVRRIATMYGATYDATTDRYSLNGLDDITEAQMTSIIAGTLGVDYSGILAWRFAFSNLDARTNLLSYGVRGVWCGSSHAGSGLTDCYCMCYYNSDIEVLRFTWRSDWKNNDSRWGLNISNGYSMFGDCPNLKAIIGWLGMRNCTAVGSMFTRCAKLESVFITGLGNNNLSLSGSPLLTMESIATMINESKSDTFYIVLHDTAYANAKSSAEVATALHDHPNVTLHNADNTLNWCDDSEFEVSGSTSTKVQTCSVVDDRVIWTPVQSGGGGVIN